MRMKEIFTAKSIEEAKHLAVEKFGVSEDQIVFRILEEPKKGIFGKVKREAQVEAVYEAAEEAAPAETTEAKAPEQPEAPQPQAKAAPAMPVSRPVQEAVSSVEEIIIDKDDNSPTRGMESEAIETILTEGEMSPNLLRARQYIADIYAAMGITVTIGTMRTANGIRMELRSDNKSGTIIGRRGETLDSIQYLASILVNKDSEDYCRLLLDSNGYREKRRKTLEQLAEKIARSVLRSGRSTTLEPMNPYERRIIHSKIFGDRGRDFQERRRGSVPEGRSFFYHRQTQRRKPRRQGRSEPRGQASLSGKEAGRFPPEESGFHEDQLRTGL